MFPAGMQAGSERRERGLNRTDLARPSNASDLGETREGDGAQLAPKALGNRRGAPRSQSQAALRRAPPVGNGLRGGKRKLGRGEKIGWALRLGRRFAIFAHPARQESLSGFLNPLFEQHGDLLRRLAAWLRRESSKLSSEGPDAS